MKEKLLISIPYSYNYRNYVLSGFVNKLSSFYDITIKIEKKIEIDQNFKLSKNIKIEKDEFKRSFFQRFLYKIIKERIFHLQNTYTYRTKLADKNFIDKVIKYPLPKSRFVLNIFIKLYNILNTNFKLKKELKKFDKIIFTMAHKPYENKIFINSSKKSTKINIIHSWDVITTKGAYFYNYNKNIVWNKINQDEYNKYIYNKLNFNNPIHISAPLQFIKYNKNTFTPGNYVLYATSVERLVKKEIEIIRKVYDLCIKIGVPLKIRNHPQRNKFIYIENNQVFEKSKEKISSRDNANFNVKFFSDIEDDIKNSFVVISVASTIALDALCLNKNTLYIGYNNGEDLLKYYKYEHLKSLINNCSIPIITNDFQLEENLTIALKRKSIPNNEIKNHINLDTNIFNYISLIK